MTTENESPDLRRYREEWAAMTARVQALEGERVALRSILLEQMEANIAVTAALQCLTARVDTVLKPPAPGGAKVDGVA